MKLYNISFNNLRRRKGKVVFLVAGLLIGIATIVTLLSITESMTQDIEDRLDQFGANIVMVPKSENLSLSYGGITVGGVSYEMNEFLEEDIPKVRMIKDSRNLGAVAPKILGGVEVKGQKILLMGVNFDVEFPLKTWWQLEGSTPTAENDLVLGAEAAAVLGVDVGDSLEIKGSTFNVAALLQATGAAEDGLVIGSMNRVQQVLGKEGKISMVEIAAFCRDCPIEEMVLQIAEQFPDARVTPLQQAVMSKMQSIGVFKSFSYGIAGLVIFIGSLMVAVTMMGAVNERTREIGIFRAIGFRRGHVMQIILLEAVVVGLIGGLLGFTGGNSIAWAVMPLVLPGSNFAGVNFQVGAVVIFLSVALSLLASLYPAHKGSQLDPSDALRTL